MMTKVDYLKFYNKKEVFFSPELLYLEIELQ